MLLSVIIPARNEIYLQKTIENVLENIEGDTEIIAVCDGYWPEPPIQDHPRVTLIHNTEAIGQRPAINQAMKIARGKYMMKLDGHCAVDKGFDVKLAKDAEKLGDNVTQVPRMYNLDVLKWKPKLHKRTDYMYISSPTAEKPFRASYYGRKQPKSKRMIDDTMCCMGPGWFMSTKRFWELGGCDEGHGHWGQQGIEVACKAWLSGGRLVVNKNTWFAHWFRGGGVPEGHKAGFPYKMTQGQVEKARKYSQDLWLNNKWDKKVRDFQWLVDKFNPPTWNDMEKNETSIIYYTDNTCPEPLFSKVQENLDKMGKPILAVAQKDFKTKMDCWLGVMELERSHLSLFKQVKEALNNCDTKYVALAEHDCFYPKSHFDFIPPKDDVFYYDTNHWFVDYKTSKYHRPYQVRRALSGLVCNRKLLLEAVNKRIEFLENGGELQRGIAGACEFGFTDDYKAEDFSSKDPYLDVRHGNNFSGYRKGKHRTFSIPYWGSFDKIIGRIPPGKWYQEATINGIEMPTRRKHDTNEKRWQKFVEPLVQKKDGVFTDLGGNASFYCRKMSDLGYKTWCVEREDEFVRQGAYWESSDPKGVRYFQGNIMDYELTASHLVLMANIHYWLTPEENKKLVAEFKNKAYEVLVIGRYKTLERHKSPCTLEYLRELFAGWQEVKVIHDKKHFSVLFRNPDIVEKKVDEILPFQQLYKSKKFFPSYNKLIDKVLKGEQFDPLKTEYFEYMKWRRFKDKEGMIQRHIELIPSMQERGIIIPITIGRMVDGQYEPNRLVDGDHRLIVAKKLGINNIICRQQ